MSYSRRRPGAGAAAVTYGRRSFKRPRIEQELGHVDDDASPSPRKAAQVDVISKQQQHGHHRALSSSTLSSPPLPPPTSTPRRRRPQATSLTTSSPLSPTPTRAAKDLSALFEGVGDEEQSPTPTPACALHPSPARLVGRMAPRRTQMAPGHAAAAAAAAPPASPSPSAARDRFSSSQPSAGPSREHTPSPSPRPASQPESLSHDSPNARTPRIRPLGINAPTLPGARRTYGAQRSFLAEVEVGHDGVSAPSLRGVHAAAVTSVETAAGGVAAPPPLTAPTDTHALGILRRSAGQTVATSMDRKSYLELRKRYGGDSDLGVSFGGDVEAAASGSQGSLSSAHAQQLQSVHSISTLRTAGEMRRFNDDLEYLLSGLADDQSDSMRKASAVEVLRKVCGANKYEEGLGGEEDAADTEFLAQLRSVGAIERVFELLLSAATGTAPPSSQRASAAERVIGVSSDAVCAVVLAVFLARIAQAQVICESFVQQNGALIFAVLDALLLSTLGGRGADPLTELDSVKAGKSVVRGDRKQLAALHEIVRTCRVLPPASAPSLRALVLSALANLTTFRPRGSFHPIARLVRLSEDREASVSPAKDSAGDPSSPPPTIQLVSRVLAAEMAKAERRMIAFTRGLDLLPTRARGVEDTAPDFGVTETCARIMELVTGTQEGDAGALRGRFGASSTAADLLAGVQICHLLTRLDDAGDARLLRAGGRDVDDEAEEGVDSDAGAAIADTASAALLGLLKTLINLTQADEGWCGDLLALTGALTTIVRLIMVPFRELARASEAAAPSDRRSSAGDTDERIVEQQLRRVSPADPSTPSSASEADEADARLTRLAQRFDVLCLALSLLINLLEAQPSTARPLLAALILDPSCARRACARTCACTDSPAKRRRAEAEQDPLRAHALTHLATAFEWHHRRCEAQGEERDENAAFLMGCLALVLALAVGGEDVPEEEEDGMRRATLVAAGLGERSEDAARVRAALRPVALTLAELEEGERREIAAEGDEGAGRGLVARMAANIKGFVEGGA